MDNNSTKTGIGVGGLCLLWGIITQCLQWSGVIAWPFWAIWGPLLLDVAIVLAVLLIVLIVFVIAEFMN